ncbi:MAG: cyclic pyranopterin monophosphate synthase MoaC [Terriglobales bacterium]
MPPPEPRLSHVRPQGGVRMVSVSDKPATVRTAGASARVHIGAAALRTLRRGGGAKGEVLEIARIAGIMAAKRTWELIPLCHPLPLTGIELEARYIRDGIVLRSQVSTTATTGVEMEALTAVSVAALTVYDMAKALGHDITFAVQLEYKSGGRSGSWKRPRR